MNVASGCPKFAALSKHDAQEAATRAATAPPLETSPWVPSSNFILVCVLIFQHGKFLAPLVILCKIIFFLN